MATAVTVSAPPRPSGEGRLTQRGLTARVVVALALIAAVILIPLTFEPFTANTLTGAVIFAIVGLSVNILMGHAGQIPLGHQAFVGVGAFASAYMVTVQHQSFFLGLVTAGLTGAIAAFLLGLVALRLRGLYLALVTLAYGQLAQSTLFQIRSLTGGGAGQAAPRPGGFTGDHAYLYLCMGFLGLFLLIDWRLMKSKGGRAIVEVRTDERVAASMGINVTAYKLLAFVLSGIMAGVAGSLLAHQTQFVSEASFNLELAITFVLMTVVGGLESKAGVVIGSMFFALFPTFLSNLFGNSTNEILQRLPDGKDAIGALLLILTLTRFPGGIGQQISPVTRWLSGGRFRHGHHRRAGEMAASPIARRGAAPSAEELKEIESELASAELQHASGEDPEAKRPARKAPAKRKPASSRSKRRPSGGSR